MLTKVQSRFFSSIEGLFENYYQPYIEFLNIKLSAYEYADLLFSNQENKEFCLHQLIDGVLLQLSDVAMYSLLDFYYDKKAKDAMTYKSFNNLLLDDSFVADFHTAYPLVKERCHIVLKNYLKRILEVFDKLKDYQSALLNFINVQNVENLDISSLDIFQGDFHKQTFVAIVELHQHKIVFKRRPNIGEQLLEIFSYQFQNAGLNLPVIKSKLLNEELTIQEFIEPTASELTDEEIENFYFKFGMMTAVFTILGSKDLHQENLIATRKGPYFIDLEAAITGQRLLNDYSLLKTSHLFNCNEKQYVNKDIDLSAFSGKTASFSTYQVINKGTDEIRMGYNEMTKKQYNIPNNQQGEEVNPEDYAEFLIRGFDQAITVFQKFRSSFMEAFNKLDYYNYRLVLRNTAFYGIYLHHLNLPIYTKDKARTEHLLSLLEKNSTRDTKIIQEEIKHLRQMEVPYFTISQFGELKKIKELFLKRLMNLNSSDFAREKHYLLMALKVDAYEEGCGRQENFESTDDRLSHEISTFESLSLLEQQFSYGAVDLSVQGRILNYCNDLFVFGGSMLFLYRIRTNRHKEIKQTINQNNFRPYISGLTGYQSSLLLKYYFKANVENQEGDGLSIQDMIHKEDIVDFSTYGSAILVLHYLYQKTKKNLYLSDLKFLGEIYLDKSENQTLTGLFHGYAGDSLVFSVLSNYFEENLIYQRLESALLKENEHFLENKNWQDMREGISDSRSFFAFSYGAVGIVLSRLLLYLKANTPTVVKKIAKKDIQRGVDGILLQREQDFADDSLLNGYAGALFLLKIVLSSDLFREDKARTKKVQNYISEGKEYLIQHSWHYQNLKQFFNPAFANGQMGVAFALWYISREETFLLSTLLEFIERGYK
ncbi:DUF4135 domain-containing protein [Streptococcus sp. H31]|uniref:DUF4135 domain-containing protein n=1 Tax=Streptococcus huangxiaojuni TaxID=3237239 RepID=UPI0034A0EF48